MPSAVSHRAASTVFYDRLGPQRELGAFAGGVGAVRRAGMTMPEAANVTSPHDASQRSSLADDVSRVEPRTREDIETRSRRGVDAQVGVMSFEETWQQETYRNLENLLQGKAQSDCARLLRTSTAEDKSKLSDLAIAMHAIENAIADDPGREQLLGAVKLAFEKFVKASIAVCGEGKTFCCSENSHYRTLCKEIMTLAKSTGGERIIRHFRESSVDPALGRFVEAKLGRHDLSDPRDLMDKHAADASLRMVRDAVETFEHARDPGVAIHALAHALTIESRSDQLLRNLKPSASEIAGPPMTEPDPARAPRSGKAPETSRMPPSSNGDIVFSPIVYGGNANVNLGPLAEIMADMLRELKAQRPQERPAVSGNLPDYNRLVSAGDVSTRGSEHTSPEPRVAETSPELSDQLLRNVKSSAFETTGLQINEADSARATYPKNMPEMSRVRPSGNDEAVFGAVAHGANGNVNLGPRTEIMTDIPDGLKAQPLPEHLAVSGNLPSNNQGAFAGDASVRVPLETPPEPRVVKVPPEPSVVDTRTAHTDVSSPREVQPREGDWVSVEAGRWVRTREIPRMVVTTEGAGRVDQFGKHSGTRVSTLTARFEPPSSALSASDDFQEITTRQHNLHKHLTNLSPYAAAERSRLERILKFPRINPRPTTFRVALGEAAITRQDDNEKRSCDAANIQRQVSGNLPSNNQGAFAGDVSVRTSLEPPVMNMPPEPSIVDTGTTQTDVSSPREIRPREEDWVRVEAGRWARTREIPGMVVTMEGARRVDLFGK